MYHWSRTPGGRGYGRGRSCVHSQGLHAVLYTLQRSVGEREEERGLPPHRPMLCGAPTPDGGVVTPPSTAAPVEGRRSRPSPLP